jgi:hypothetical protein
MNWTQEQVIALSPDASSTKNGQKLANLQKWLSLGTQENALWGECKGSGKNPYQTQIDLSEPAFKCSCPSRKFPCKHALALFLLYVNQSNSFIEIPPPEWVTTWLENRANRQQKQQEKALAKTKIVDPQAQQKRIEQREQKVKAGLEDLSLILTDIIRQGLAHLPSQSYDYWDKIAARMVDAQAQGLARQIKQISSIIYSGEGWQERLLIHLGKLYLILEGYSNLDALDPQFQADLKNLIGWTIKQEELLTMTDLKIVTDQWLIVGKKVEEEDRLKIQRTWLWGEKTKEFALILDFAYGNQVLDVSLITGTKIEAELIFFPSAYPLRAIMKEKKSSPQLIEEMQGEQSINEALLSYSQALASLPWLEQYPMLLSNVIPVKNEANWFIKDQENKAILINQKFSQNWQLLAISGGHPLAIFGEWKKDNLLPLAVCCHGKFLVFD